MFNFKGGNKSTDSRTEQIYILKIIIKIKNLIFRKSWIADIVNRDNNSILTYMNCNEIDTNGKKKKVSQPNFQNKMIH
jgi:translation initiation factor 2 beta subunit (eIF-2beta)/eIF-5